ncbi:ABC transporter permease [Pseudonocardia spinosispora]|uniref:ABC transporter permease n=1 Tax=Pseudonocardia spinosispora TaxID=103441 RepID=UPI0004292D8A|nr:ABC transporter permease [Pseudonocardia spinosispora]
MSTVVTPRVPRAGRALRSTGAIAAATAAALLVLIGLMALATPDPIGAVGGLLTGAVSSPGRAAQWLSYASFLMLTGASVCLVFRVGMFSIGAEGQVFVGGLLAGLVALMMGPTPMAIPVGIAAAIVGGFLWALIPGLMKAYLGADEIVTSLMMNYIGTFLFAFVVKQFLMPEGAGYPVSKFFPHSNWLPTIGTAPAIPSTMILGLAACILVGVLLDRTRLGYALRMVGDSPRFAHANGLHVPRLIWVSIAVSGAVAGVAGAAIAFGSTHRLILGMATGLGFDGVLVALLAVNRPMLVPLTALAYGYLRTGGDVMQITANVPRDVVVVVQGLLIIALAAALRRRTGEGRGRPATGVVAGGPPPGTDTAPPDGNAPAGADASIPPDSGDPSRPHAPQQRQEVHDVLGKRP